MKQSFVLSMELRKPLWS